MQLSNYNQCIVQPHKRPSSTHIILPAIPNNAIVCRNQQPSILSKETIPLKSRLDRLGVLSKGGTALKG